MFSRGRGLSVFRGQVKAVLFLVGIGIGWTVPGWAQIPIDTLAELQMIGNHPAYPLDGSYVLTTDILATATEGWNSGAGFEPIGSETNPFTGVFDGQGHVIRNLTIRRPDENYVGLFAKLGIGSTVQNLGLENVFILGLNRVGGLAGYIQSANNLVNVYVTGQVRGMFFVGAIVGQSWYGRLTGCYAACVVKGVQMGAGLVGWSTSSQITRCYAASDVAVLNYGGGLMGFSMSDTVAQCYSTGPVTGTAAIGGLIGWRRRARPRAR